MEAVEMKIEYSEVTRWQILQMKWKVAKSLFSSHACILVTEQDKNCNVKMMGTPTQQKFLKTFLDNKWREYYGGNS